MLKVNFWERFLKVLILSQLILGVTSCSKDPEKEERGSVKSAVVGPFFDCSKSLTPELLRGKHHHSRVPIPGKFVVNKNQGHFILLSGDHTHKFFIANGDFKRLAKGDAVVLNESDGLNHGHQVSLKCPNED